MTFPIITFTHKNVTSDQDLQALVTSKLEPLEKYFSKESNTQCDVEFERITSHQQGPVARLEVNLWVGDKLARAEATAETFAKAIDEAKQDLEHELERLQTKRISLMRKGARRIKEMMRWGR